MALGFPKEARWQTLQDNAKQPTFSKLIVEAMVAIDRDNPELNGILLKVFRLGRPALDKHRLGEMIDVIGTIGLGDGENRSKGIVGHVYEYFLTQFASAEGKNGGQFFTSRCVVRVLVEMLAPYKGGVYDPCCGSVGMFVQSEKFIEEHGGSRWLPISSFCNTLTVSKLAGWRSRNRPRTAAPDADIQTFNEQNRSMPSIRKTIAKPAIRVSGKR